MWGEKNLIICLWYSGVVRGHKTQGSEFLYCVEKDGQSNWYSRTSVILSMEQGNRLREQYGLGPYEPSTPQTMASDISLGESSIDLFKPVKVETSSGSRQTMETNIYNLMKLKGVLLCSFTF